MRLRYILAVAALFSLVLSIGAPPLSGPDETAHIAYVAALANGHMPRLGGMHEADIVNGVTFEAQHPPLFYAIASLPFRVFGSNVAFADHVIRLIGVASFLLTIFFAYHLTAKLTAHNKHRRWPLLAALLVATNPHLLFVSSMANNDGFSIMLATASLLAAATFGQKAEHGARWPLLIGIIGGLALLTKSTAIGPVLAAAYLVGQGTAPMERLRRGGMVLVIAALFIAPWLLYMKENFSTLAPQQFNPVFRGGWIEALGQPEVVLYACYMIWSELCPGIALPLWQTHTLFGNYPWYFYVEWFFGFLVGLGVFWLAWREKQAWAAVVLPAIFLLITWHSLIRDREAILFASRYGIGGTVAVSVLVASYLSRQKPVVQRALSGVWLCGALGLYIFIFSFLGRGR